MGAVTLSQSEPTSYQDLQELICNEWIKMDKKKVLLKNTIMLYVLIFSNYILNLIVVPYQTRVLGPEKYGLIGLASAIVTYLQLFVDFGFLLSATEDVAKNRTDTRRLSQIFTSVTIVKSLFSILSMIAIIAICGFIPRWKENLVFIALYCLMGVLSSLLPDFLYRGIEQMTTITVRTVLIRVFFTAMTLVFVKQPEDYYLIPVFQIVGNAGAWIATYIHMKKKLNIHFVRCSGSELLGQVKRSAPFFASRIAGTVYSTANTLILDISFAGQVTAFYTSADKLVSTARSGVSPISDSMYPYMVANRDFTLVKKVLLIFEPIIIIGCAVLFVWATPICAWFFGDEYAQTGIALRAQLPIVVFTLPSYIFGFPVLSAMGLSKHANNSIVLASVVHIFNLGVLLVLGKINMVTLGITASIAEFIVLSYRVFVVVKNRRLLEEA